MRRNLSILLLITLSLLLGESCKQSVATSARNNDEPVVASIPENPEMLAVLYQQTAAEYRALCYQAFNVAEAQLDLRLKETHGMKAYSVVVDIDETMLDNSPYEARCIIDNFAYPEGWDEWMKEASARAVPGALDFLRYAQSRGVQVFYVSNRKEVYFNETLLNLQKLGFPFAQGDHLFLKRDESSKKERRRRIEEKTDVVMLIGDNLIDFSEVFESNNIDSRFAATDRFRDKFGTQFIVLPNAMYGDWLKAVYSSDPSADPGIKAEMRRNALITK